MSDLCERLKVPVDRLRWQLDTKALDFESTSELQPTEEIIGQETAVNAIRLGLELGTYGYNIFITGLVGTGRMTVVQRLLSELIGQSVEVDVKKQLKDLCYVHNFAESDMPRLLALPPGEGCALARAMDGLIHTLRHEIPRIFESEEYARQRKTLVSSFRDRQSSMIEAFQEKVQTEGFAVIQVQMGPITRPDVLPAIGGKPVTFEQIDQMVQEGKLKSKDVEQIRTKHKNLVDELAAVAKEMRTIERSVRESVQSLNRDILKDALEDVLQEIRARFEYDAVTEFLTEVERDILDSSDRFQAEDDGEALDDDEVFRFYRVNVIVDNSRSKSRPIVVETHPSYRSVFGTIEGPVDSEVTRADFSHIRAGGLLRANGGYLILNALDVFTESGVWPALKRTLRTGLVEIQPMPNLLVQWGAALKPQPVEVRTKVVMIGDSHIYSILYAMDEDFRKIFKVKAEFDAVMQLSDAAIEQYGRFTALMCRSEGLLPFDRSAVADVVEYGVRRAGRQDKLSTHFTYIKDVIVEASYWAQKDGAGVVSGKHVLQALDAGRERVSLGERRLREAVDHDEILIDTTGRVVGQVNGLAVYSLGDHAFGMPSRITASVGVGRAGVINIEREVELSGSTHDKGVLILTGLLRDRFAREAPLAMSASLCFEQNYGGVDGDSASSTEAYALLSALSGLPLRQDIAVTGSINQKGEIQPIGGVNEKIEGFFDVCRSRGLTGEQGVLIPRRNVPHLMLRQDVVDAVQEGKFSIISIDTIDQGIEVLTGVPAGEPRGDRGAYPDGSVYAAVERRLHELNQRVKEFGSYQQPGPL